MVNRSSCGLFPCGTPWFMEERQHLLRTITSASHKTCLTGRGGTVRIIVVFSLLVTLVIPITLYSEVDNSSNKASAYLHVGHYGGGVTSNDLFAMESNPPDQVPSPASSLCRCWACSWDQRIFCNSPESHPEYCKQLTFSCYGPSPADCCKK